MGIVSHCLGYSEITKLLYYYITKWLQRNSNFHRSSTSHVSERNTNANIKRGKAFIEEHNAKVFYKSGKENFVADAINSVQNEPQSDVATVHSKVSLTYTVESTDKPLNCFRNQIILEEASQPSRRNFIIFGSKTRHIIHYNNKDSLLELVKEVVNVNVVNAIHCDLHTLACIQHALVLEFPATKFWHCKRFVNDITNANEQSENITCEHNRAHKAAQENVKQVLQDYYFPKMTKLANEVVGKSVLIRGREVHKSTSDKTPFNFSIGSHAPDTYTYLPYKVHSSFNLSLSYRIAGIVLITLAVVNARVTDYSLAQYIPVTDRDRTGVGTETCFAASNLTEFSAMIDDTAKLSDLFPQSHMRKLLEVDTNHIRSLLFVLKIYHRMARSLDFLGTALKVTLKCLKCPSPVNKIIKAKQNNIVVTSHLNDVILARNRILISEIQNVMLTVTLAKANIISPAIFNHDDLKSVLVDHPHRSLS